MARLLLLLAALLFAQQVQAADVAGGYTQGPGGYYKVEDRSGPYSIGTDGTAVLMGVPMPFVRAADPFVLPATTTPQQYLIRQPLGAKSYRGANPCMMADVRVKSVVATTPMVLEPVTYQGLTLPGVQRVTSSSQAVSSVTGTRIIRSFVDMLGSSPNPMGGQDRVISVMIINPPGNTTDLSAFTCPFELQYGNGG